MLKAQIRVTLSKRFACQVVRGLGAFAPYLRARLCGGRGSSVANAGFMIHDSIGNYM